MTNKITNISWKGNAWLRFGERATSFAFNQIFSDLHFTISHFEGDEFVNFHLSKDKGPENNKAKIVIAKIRKTELDLLCRTFNLAFWKVQMIPFDLRKYRYRRPKKDFRAQYFSIPRFQISDDYPEFIQEMTEIFDRQSTKRGRKIQMNKDIDFAFSKSVRSPKIARPIRNNIRKFTGRIHSHYDYGLFISKEYTGLVIFTNGQWYRLKPELRLVELLSTFMPAQLAKSLSFKFTMALARINNATSYDEIKFYNQPIELYIEKSKD